MVGLLFPDFAEPPQYFCPFAACLVQVFFEAADFFLRLFRGEVGAPLQDGANGFFEFFLGFDPVTGPAHAQGLDFFGEFFFEDAQGPGGVAGDQHFLSLGEQVSDQVGDGVGLPGAGRSLDDDEVALVESFRDGALLLVGGKREVGFAGRGSALVFVVDVCEGVAAAVVVSSGEEPQQRGEVFARF